MENKLYDACLKGDVGKLEALMREDELTLARVSISSCFNQTPLHLVSMLGHFEFAKSLLSYKRDFASRLDSQGRSPLHLASANGYANMVQLLLKYETKMCQIRDEDGRTPLHLAVMNGQQESVIELIKVNSESYDQEGTVLHLCVTYNRLNVLICLLELNDRDLLNIKDGNGNTILHSATTFRRMEIIKYLVSKSRSRVDVNALNENGVTALDIIEQMPKDLKTMEMKELLVSAGTLMAKEINQIATKTHGGLSNDDVEGAAATDSNSKMVLKMWWNKVKNFTIFQEKMEKRDQTLLIAATLIAVMAYAAAISPPGGVAGMDAKAYQEDPQVYYNKYRLLPGSSLLAYFFPSLSDTFWIYNTISFMASLSVIFIYVSGATLKKKVFIWLIRAGMWITLSAMILAYKAAVQATCTRDVFEGNKTLLALTIGLYTWMILILVSLLIVGFRSGRYIVMTIKKHKALKRGQSMGWARVDYSPGRSAATHINF